MLHGWEQKKGVLKKSENTKIISVRAYHFVRVPCQGLLKDGHPWERVY